MDFIEYKQSFDLKKFMSSDQCVSDDNRGDYSKLDDMMDFGDPKVIGDIFISTDYIRDNRTNKDNFFDEIDFLVIHSFLHLLGFDHEELQDEKVMWPLQDNLYSRFRRLS
jgi:rRNA maturation RNase YbeY